MHGHTNVKFGENFIYALKRSVAFTTPIFTKLTNAQRDDVEGSCIKFHPDRFKKWNM